MCRLQGKAGGPPELTYGSPVDYYAAALVASGVASALFERERSGLGQYVGVSLLRSAMAMQSARMVQADGERHDIARDMRSGGITGLHPTADGWLYLSANTAHFWQALCERTGLAALGQDPRYDTVKNRARHADELMPQLRAALLTRTAEEWEALLADAVPCSVARSVEDMFDHPQVESEGVMTTIPHPTLGSYRGVTQPIKFSRTPGPEPFAAPLLDEDGDALKKALSKGAPAPRSGHG
jgi:formyl-CoA transferase